MPPSSAPQTPFLHLLLPSPTKSFKKEEFRSCDEAPFCSHYRNRPPHSAPILTLTNITNNKSSLTALLTSPTSPPLLLSLSLHSFHTIRLQIDQQPPRFHVPYVILPNLQTLPITTSTSSSTTTTTVTLSNNLHVILHHHPFSLLVTDSHNNPVLSFNSNGHFEFEQTKTKEDIYDYSERFRSHVDSRPHGPQSISFDVSFHSADFLYGIPQHASPSLALSRHADPYRLFNLDVFEYEHDSPFGVYGSVPFMLSHGPKRSSGFFWLNAAEMFIDILGDNKNGRIDTLWMAEAGVVDAFFFTGPGPKDVMRQYAEVTGTSAMPQEFAIAYHQCRWNYRDEEDVANVDEGFDENDIPYDVIWLDIDHTDGRRYFTWDKASFPNPMEMQRKLADKGRKMVAIVDPHIKRDDDYYVHKEASRKGYYVKDASGKDFDGWCWCGSSSYPDMLNPAVREWWADKFSLKNYVGSTPSLYIWNDMNEPSVFNGPEITMPRDAIHFGGVEHREVHNAYGLYFHMATSNGLLKRGNSKDRPFVLSRAIFAGSQRYGAIWTGDNTASWEHLRVSVPMILNLGLAGISFAGADVGGFFGTPETDLLVRWYQVGAYYPFFRSHAHHDTRRREPWLFGERNTALMREAIQTRYSFLPYYYTLFREANISGVPVMRPLWMEFPADKETYNNAQAFLIGSSLLVQGIYEKNQKSISVYLPAGQPWYNLRSAVRYEGGLTHNMKASDEYIPSFQRAGSIIPRKYRLRRSTTQMVNDPYTLVVALNDTLAAEGELYIDDGKSFDFLLGAYIHRKFVFADDKLMSINIHPTKSGKFVTKCLVERVILLGLPYRAQKAVVEPGNYEVDIELSPLALRRGSSADALTIRKPNVRIADDWSIRIL